MILIIINIKSQGIENHASRINRLVCRNLIFIDAILDETNFPGNHYFERDNDPKKHSAKIG